MVSVQGPINEIPGAPKEGMVLDFTDISSIWKSTIFPLIDHHDLNQVEDIGITTAENIACWLLKMFRRNDVPVSTIEVYETETSSAHVDYTELWANGK
jgi:6-pyruvoyl-tetrahydropterin synthase